ncbi:MAG TPA: cytochrome P450 [Burkholderiaceae bacterium]|nr:cytochrome P450 [Burkholderiaceae bacterium]
MNPAPLQSATPGVRRIDNLPGPRAWPLVGNLFQLRKATIHRSVERWCREFGPAFTFHMGKQRMLVLADHELIAAALRDRPDGWRRSQQLQAVGREMGLTPGVFGSEGDVWRRQRRMVMSGLDPGTVRTYFPSLQRVTERLRQRWLRAARQRRTLDLQTELMRYTVDTVAGLAFGSDINTLESDGVVIQQHLDRIFPALYRRVLAPLPYWRWIKLPADRALERSVAEVKRTIAGFIAQARQRLRADPARRKAPPNLLEAMIVAAEDGAGIDDEQVAANVLTMLLAGEDTTAHTLGWLLHLLHRHPAAMARACDEARRVAAGHTALTPEHLAQLEFIDACIHETMRLKPVAPFMVIESLRETRLGDLHIPKGTLLWCALRHDGLDASHFERPAAFDPERWLGDGASSSAKRVTMPFGSGPRMCPGRYLALTEMKMLLAMLLSQFEINSVDTPDGREAQERMSFTMVPVGLTMRLRERAA